MPDRLPTDDTPDDQADVDARGKPSGSDRPTVDEMSEWSFPASDPPATWTWDPVDRAHDV